MEHRMDVCAMNDAERDAEPAGTRVNGTTENPVPESPSCSADLEEQKKAFTELNERFLRLVADFENFKRRTARERESIVALANERFAVDILEVVDNFDRALKADDAHLREGVMQIHQLLAAQLQRHGVTSMDAVKKPFNPAEHEAIAHVPSDETEGMVIDVVSQGYRMNDKVIRHAKVAVSKGNQNQQEE
jgi:molecular chaperone GrpE